MLRIVRFPLIRLVLLGAPLLYMMALNDGFKEKFAATPLMAIAVTIAMAGLGFAFYAGFVRFIERRPVSEFNLQQLPRELGIGLLIGAGLYTACVLILMVLGVYRIEGVNPISFMIPAIALALSSGVFEELVFRGALFRVVEEWLGS